MIEKRLGRIRTVKFGYGGYQDVQFGITFDLGGDGWGVGDFKGAWSLDIKVDKYTKWTEQDRDKEFSKVMRYINTLLQQAKKLDVKDLVEVPVEVEFENMTLKSWRILKEVL